MSALDKQEVWKAIPGFPDYEASSYGRIGSWKPARNFAPKPKERRVLAMSKDKNGYFKTVLASPEGRKTMRACRLVALAWHGVPAEGMVVRHLDGTKDNDSPSNLAWGTPKENSMDMEDHNTRRRGQDINTSKLTEGDVVKILKSSEGPTVLAAKYGVTPANISHIRCGRSWNHVVA